LRTAGSTAGPKVAWAEAYLHTKWHLNSSSRLAATDMGRKFGGLCPVPVQHNVHWAEAYLRTKWHLDPSSRSATINMGRKLGVGLCPPFAQKLVPVELLEILENWLSEGFTCAVRWNNSWSNKCVRVFRCSARFRLIAVIICDYYVDDIGKLSNERHAL